MTRPRPAAAKTSKIEWMWTGLSVGLALAVVVGMGAREPTPAAEPPNDPPGPKTSEVGPPRKHIAVLVFDDLGVDQLPCYGEGEDLPAMPHVCGLAREGVLFRNAWATPTCSPTRATAQTGRFGFRTGVTFAGDVLLPAEVTIPEALVAQLGEDAFATAAIGKWHLAGGNRGEPPDCPPGDPRDQGYDFAAGSPRNIRDYYHWCRSVNGEPGVCTVGGDMAACAEQPYATIVNVNDALGWLKEQRGSWFLWLAFNAPHAPFQAPPKDCPGGPCHDVELPAGIEPGDLCPGAGPARACFKAMLQTLDTEVGRLLAHLPPDTEIIALGDNGTPGPVVVPPFDPERAKFTLYEGGINVPLILHGPTVEGLGVGGAEVDALVHTVDLFGTVLELAGAEVPTEPVHDSVSLLPRLTGSPGRPWVYSELRIHDDLGWAVRGERYKLMRPPGQETRELYDLDTDPFETRNLLAEGAGELTEEQKKAMAALRAAVEGLHGGAAPAVP